MQEKFFPNCTAYKRCEGCYLEPECSLAKKQAEDISRNGTPKEALKTEELINTATDTPDNIIYHLNQMAEAIAYNQGTSLNDTLDYGFPAHGCHKVSGKPRCP